MNMEANNVSEELKAVTSEGYGYEDDEVLESIITEAEESDAAESFNGNLVVGGERSGGASGSSSRIETTVSSPSSSSNPFGFMGDFDTGVAVVVPIVAFIITILMFVLVAERKKAPKNGFLRWLREFLNFRSILISGIIKFVYLFSAITLTILSFIVMTKGGNDSVLEAILAGLVILVFGNILLRVMMESIMIMIGLWKNTSDIRAVIVRDDERPDDEGARDPEEVEAPKKPAEPVESRGSQERETMRRPQAAGGETQVAQRVQVTRGDNNSGR